VPEYRRLAFLFAVALAVILPFQGTRGLYDSTEGRYAEVAREMMQRGSLVHPTLAGEPHYTKPPPAYWLVEIGLRTLGTNTWGARLGNAIVFALTVVVVAATGAALWGPTVGRAAGLVYLSSPLPFAAASVVSADTLLVFWSCCAMLAFVRGVESPGERRWIRLMWLAIGLGFATKGPPALFPLAPVVLYRLRGDRPVRIGDPWGLLLFLVAGFWWYAAIALQVPGMATTFVQREILERNFTSHIHRNSEWFMPLILYVPVLVVGSGAWLVYVARGTSRSKVAESARALLARPIGLPTAVAVGWFALPFAILCLSRSRLVLYVLAVFPPVALFFARPAASRGPGLRMTTRIALVSCVVLIGIKAASALVPHRADSGRLYRAACEAGGTDPRLVLVDDPGRHGLDFYTRGSLERVSFGEEPWANRTLDAVTADVARAGDGRTRVFIVAVPRTDAVTQALERHGLAPRVVRTPGWSLVVCPATTSATGE
jgi:4-amino-4-deoxy-L-arabinose transferase